MGRDRMMTPETPVTLANCEDEPIHIPGAIQPHGALVAFRAADLSIVHASANLADLTGIEASSTATRSVVDLVSAADAERLRAVLPLGQDLRDRNPFPLVSASGRMLDAVFHQVEGKIVMELEAREAEKALGFDPKLRQALVRLQHANGVDSLTTIAAEEVRAITGFDRVMIYRFDRSWNGKVVAEAKREDLETFLGLNYPASDIPAQARRLYAQNWLRLIADVGYTPVPLVPSRDPSNDAPLDMSQAHLRSVSPIHIEYLRNMGVRASMSISLLNDGKLTGLIACHHYSGPRVVSFEVRETCEYLGQALSWNLRVLEHADIANRVRFIQQCEAEVASSLAGTEDLLDGIAQPALVSLTAATGAAVVLQEGVRLLGKTPPEAEIGKLVTWLATRTEDVFHTDHLGDQFIPARRWDDVAAGLLAAPLSREIGEFILWFRPSTERTVEWAGDPRKQVVDDDSGVPPRLSPRGSFALWVETIRGRSLPWEEWQVEAASHLRRLLVGGARRRAATLRALNESLLDADRAKDLFIATVSHELRTPLNAISGWSQMAAAGKLPPERSSEAMQIIARNAGSLNRLVDDLLDVSRIVSGKISLDVEAVNVADVVASVLEGVTLAAEAKGLRIKSVLDTTASTVVLGDAARIRQVVTNLVSNAIKFTQKGGSITVAVARRASDLELSVRDTGPGLDTNALQHVFDLFWQVDGSIKRRNGGLGLGLAIAKKLVDLHGGKINVESEGPGRGAVFTVCFPIASARHAESLGRPGSTAEPAARMLEGLVILAVEDEPDSRLLVCQLLEDAGAVVHSAANAQAFLALASKDRADAIVSDIGMPEMDGLEMITLLRKSGGPNASVPAVALSAYTRASDRTSALRAGFQAHVPKPADPDELVTVVASLAKRI